LIALAFEFVNGFHDTANAVATVIYTRALPTNFAVIWSVLPVELISRSGAARDLHVFALLIAAIIWNLGTAAPNAAAHDRGADNPSHPSHYPSLLNH
jgi:PiT family inorganic phosphate transporter